MTFNTRISPKCLPIGRKIKHRIEHDPQSYDRAQCAAFGLWRVLVPELRLGTSKIRMALAESRKDSPEILLNKLNSILGID
jgi:hypothetical protein